VCFCSALLWPIDELWICIPLLASPTKIVIWKERNSQLHPYAHVILNNLLILVYIEHRLISRMNSLIIQYISRECYNSIH
jgi:hypothetical protein